MAYSNAKELSTGSTKKYVYTLYMHSFPRCVVGPVVEVGAVAEVLAAQLAGLPDVGQAVDELRLHKIVLAELVEVLPGLATPVSADLLTHVPVGAQQAGL